jgi:type I restriction enzyme S subunit
MGEKMKEGWEKVRLKDVISFDPKVSLAKGEEYSCIMMDDIIAGDRYVSPNKKKVFSNGGSKFEEGDILFARITPCLENGKIAQVKKLETDVGFGSTEFFVLRNIEGITDKSFVYYLSVSDMLRGPAIKSMSGASGRQRASRTIIENIEIDLPPLPIQRKIASILSAYDDLIENNTRRIKIFEDMAQTIYREWFINFRFPGHEKVKMVDSELGKIPEGWGVRKLGEVLELAYGKALKKDDRMKGNFPVYGSGGIVGYHSEYLVKGSGIIVGRKGNVGSVFWSQKNFYPIDTVFFVKTNISLYYVFFNLKNQNFVNNDAAVPGLNRNQAYTNRFILPSNILLQRFADFVVALFKKIENLQSQIENLRRTRDLLLPKLIDGEIDAE